MIREISWYLKENRFADIANEIESAVGEYASAKRSAASPDDITALRERARALCEQHIAESGYRDGEENFVNVDAEFMAGDSVDAKALDSFIKEIIKAHCYQKVLWTYMGTTGSFTQITKIEMKNQGLEYEQYLPSSYKKESPPKQPLGKKLEPNAVPIYAYADGTVSGRYDPERARLRFDALKDSSGVDWKKGYDPNASVSKDGWHGAFDDSGTWVKVDRTKAETASAPCAPKGPEPVRIIREGDSAVLLDRDGALLENRSLLYQTENGELYGALDAKPMATVDAIAEALLAMGIKKISSVARDGNGEEDKLATAYKKALGPLAAKNLSVISAKEGNEIMERSRLAERAREEEARAISIERSIESVRAAGSTGAALEHAMLAGYATVPLHPAAPADASALSLTQEERDHVAALKVPADREGAFSAALSNLYAAWSLYGNGGLTKADMAAEAHRLVVLGKKSDKTLCAETTVESIARGPSPVNVAEGSPTSLVATGIPGTFSDEQPVNLDDSAARDSFLARLERTKTLPKGGKDAAIAAIESLPPSASPEQRAKDHRAIVRVLAQYPTISASTGSTIAETVSEAVRSVGGKPRAGAQAPTQGRANTAPKRVFYELPLDGIITEAAKENHQTRAVPVDALVTLSSIGAKAPTAVIGGTTGKSVTELGYTSETLTKKYHMSDKEAAKAENFLHGIRLPEGTNGVAETTLASLVIESLTEGGRKAPAPTATEFKKRLLSRLDERNDVTYNLASEQGIDAYAKGKRFKTSGVPKESLAALVETRIATAPARTQPANASVRAVAPVYVSRPGIVPANRTTAKGIPERVRVAVTDTQPARTVTPAKVTEPDTQQSTTISQSPSMRDNTVTHATGIDSSTLPTLIVGGLPSGGNAATETKTLASIAGLTETKLVSTYGYSTTEAKRARSFLEDIVVPAGKADIAKAEIVPALRKSLKSAKSSKTMKESFIESLSPRTDVAYNLTSPRGRSSYTRTQQFVESGMTTEKLEKAILKAQKDNGDEAPVYAQRTVTVGGNSIAEESAAFMGETVVLKNAGTALSSELVHGSAETPSLIFGGERVEGARGNSSKTASPTTLAAVAGLSAPKLVEKYGFTAVEADKAAEVLRNITVPEGKTGVVTSEILPELKRALDSTKTSKGLKSELASRFGARPDVAYNLATTQGRAAYETTPSFASSGMSAGDLMRYANAIAERSPVSVRSGGGTSALPTLSTPIYARSIASPVSANMASILSTSSARTVATAISPFGAPRVSVDEVVALGKAKSASTPQTGTAITEIPTQQIASSVSASSAAIPTASAMPATNTMTNSAQNAMETSTPSARTTPRANVDPELERLRRIEANYEKDKAMLAREKAPALARSESHDVGHAEGTNGRVVSDTAEIKKLTRAMEREVANRIAEKSK